MIYPIN